MAELNTRRQWLEGDRYFRQEELTFRDCDMAGRVRPAAILSMMATAAGQDYTARGLPYERLFALRQVFLLSRIAFRLHSYAMTGETVTLSTWEDGVQGAHLRRNYGFLREDGSPFVSGRSEWILVDPVTRRILRPAQFTGKPLTCSDRPVDAPACRKVRLGQGAETLAVRRVVFSDLDRNGHLFSGNYGDVVWDHLPAALQTAALRELQINYSKEATLGEELTLLGRREGDLYEMEGLCGTERCFSCQCLF
jgi:acyl-ACP thioesterase